MVHKKIHIVWSSNTTLSECLQFLHGINMNKTMQLHLLTMKNKIQNTILGYVQKKLKSVCKGSVGAQSHTYCGFPGCF